MSAVCPVCGMVTYVLKDRRYGSIVTQQECRHVLRIVETAGKMTVEYRVPISTARTQADMGAAER